MIESRGAESRVRMISASLGTIERGAGDHGEAVEVAGAKRSQEGGVEKVPIEKRLTGLIQLTS